MKGNKNIEKKGYLEVHENWADKQCLRKQSPNDKNKNKLSQKNNFNSKIFTKINHVKEEFER